MAEAKRRIDMNLQKALTERKDELMKQASRDVAIPQGWALIQRGIKIGESGLWVLVLALQSINDPDDIKPLGNIAL